MRRVAEIGIGDSELHTYHIYRDYGATILGNRPSLRTQDTSRTSMPTLTCDGSSTLR